MHEFNKIDRRFHATLVKFDGGALFLDMAGVILRIFAEFEYKLDENVWAKTRQLWLDEHQAIIEALASRDRVKVLAAYESHLRPLQPGFSWSAPLAGYDKLLGLPTAETK